MENFIKKETADSHLPREILSSKQTGWLTKNRLWNLVFLFAVPAEIYLAALMWNVWMLILPLATTIAIFGFVPTDKSAVNNREPQAIKAVKYAAYIWFFTIIAFILAASKILSLIDIELGQFGFGEVIFFIFLIPVSILCYANIPLSSCVERAEPGTIRHAASSLSTSDPKTPVGTRLHNSRSLF